MKQGVRDINPQGKRILCRVDFNEPIEGSTLLDDFKIKAALPTIRYLLSAGARLILCAHLGRPEGVDPSLSLKPVAEHLSALLKQPVMFQNDSIGPEVMAAALALQNGEVMMLENVRFHPGEYSNDPGFAKQLAELGEIYVNDAFADSHRKHASTVGVAKYLPAVAGLLMEREILMLTRALSNYREPLMFIIAGAKVSTKLGLLGHYLNRAKDIFIGGAMANTFLAASGAPIGKSIYEPQMLEQARTLLKQFQESSTEVLLPVDAVVTKALNQTAHSHYISSVDQVATDEYIADIGKATIKKLAPLIKSAGTIIWNGPVGVTQYRTFSKGSLELAELIAASSADSYIGGGDTAEVIGQTGLADKFTFVSTGGGAALEFLEGKVLPGIGALKDKLTSQPGKMDQ